MPLLGQDVRARKRGAKPRRRAAPGGRRSERTSTGEVVAEVQGAELIAQHIAGGRHGETLELRLVNMESALREQQGMLAESHHRILALLKENESLRAANHKLRAEHSEPPEVLLLRAAVDGLQRRNEELSAALLSARRSAGTVAVATSREKSAAVQYLVEVDESTAKVAMAMSRGQAAALRLAEETNSPGRGSLPHGAAAGRGTEAAQAIVGGHAVLSARGSETESGLLPATPSQQLRSDDGSSSESTAMQNRCAGDEHGGKEARQAIAAALAAGERVGNAAVQIDEDAVERARKESLAEAERRKAVAAAAEMQVQLAKQETQATVELYQASARAASAASAAEIERQKAAALRLAEDQQYQRMLERKEPAAQPQCDGASTQETSDLQPEPEPEPEPKLGTPPQSQPNRQRLRQQQRAGFKPVQHDEAWSVSTPVAAHPLIVDKSTAERVRPGGVTARSVYGSPRSAGGSAAADTDAAQGYTGGDTEGDTESDTSATLAVAKQAGELHARVQREIWRKEREVDLSGLRAAEQEREEAERLSRQKEGEKSFGERLLCAEAGWRRPASAAGRDTKASTHRAINAADGSVVHGLGQGQEARRKLSVPQLDPSAEEGGTLLRLLRATPPPATAAAAIVSCSAGYGARSPKRAASAKAQRPQTARGRRVQAHARGVGRAADSSVLQQELSGRGKSAARCEGREGGEGPAVAWGASSPAPPPGRRPRTAPPPHARNRSKGQRKKAQRDHVVGLMLLGPQRVRIAETGALMLESIEKTAAVLEKAGLGWQQSIIDAAAEQEGQLGEKYRLV